METYFLYDHPIYKTFQKGPNTNLVQGTRNSHLVRKYSSKFIIIGLMIILVF